MNNQSPLIPQGSLLEQRNKGRARVKIAVFLVLAIHGVGLMALLMQGCKKEPEPIPTAAAEPEATNNAPPPFIEPTNAPTAASNTLAAPPSATTTPTPAPAEPPPQPVATPPPTPASDYTIAKGDTFSTVAKKFHVTVKALLEANPSVEPTKLKIGQSIHIPPATASSTASAAVPGAAADTSGQTYKVKSGDSLTKIATQFGVTVKALRSANSLKTDKIVVGQSLTIPAKTTAPAPAGTSTTTAPTGQ
jgi:LysM repeat protein